MRTRELQENWMIWLEASDRLMRVLHEQTVAITLRDSDRINRLKSEIESIQIQLADIHEDIAVATSKTAKSLGTIADVRCIAAVLEKTEAQALNGLANRVIVAERSMEALLKKNDALFECRFAVVHSDQLAELQKSA